MSAATTVRAFWEAIDRRDWDALGRLLADDVVYEVPQTRERVRGRAGVVRFNAEYPGEWHLTVTTLVAEADRAATTIGFASPGLPDQTGIAFFTLDDDGRIARIEDWWPEPYEPPADRAHLVERW
ncbi:nuclear transport factor 2 family protein [Iamia sp. SCSIO 61187]|uniref:nuclear transport factor 2 family protein n=1 Tax=Iamia sp. SCSIO 61187 TaxID=2722752 RepID=UPI001C62D2AF|nr:nuclear transport factor 2 family protein [Iamia sp. SCSIO 61187]QYG91433.1 nuclear transport factor 2 family protein [Iamia sp. SCSIO 61187]